MSTEDRPDVLDDDLQPDDYYKGIKDRRKESPVDKQAWHVSKSVPLAFVIALLIQTVALVSWAATFKAEFEAYREASEEKFSDLKDYVDTRTRDRITSAEVRAEFRSRDFQLQKLDEEDDKLLKEVHRCQQSINDRLRRIEDKLDAQADYAARNNNNHKNHSSYGNHQN